MFHMYSRDLNPSFLSRSFSTPLALLTPEVTNSWSFLYIFQNHTQFTQSKEPEAQKYIAVIHRTHNSVPFYGDYNYWCSISKKVNLVKIYIHFNYTNSALALMMILQLSPQCSTFQLFGRHLYPCSVI